MKLIRRSNSFYNHVSQDVVCEFESAILKSQPAVQVLQNDGFYIPNVLKQLLLRTNVNFQKLIPKLATETFAIHMGPDYAKSLPYYLRHRKNFGYFFDVWPKLYEDTKKFLDNSNIKIAFFSSYQATEHFRNLGYNNVFWVPEGVGSETYKYQPYCKKNIDVLELGRQNLSFHEKITPVLASNGSTHFYEKPPGQLIFEKYNDFLNGLAKTKISICFPKSTTHSENSGGISTMTNRYLQSMASKCLVVGETPSEMLKLFDYNPIINVDSENPGEDIIEILNNYDNYIPLIEKNHASVQRNHTWMSRWEQINTIIHDTGDIQK